MLVFHYSKREVTNRTVVQTHRDQFTFPCTLTEMEVYLDSKHSKTLQNIASTGKGPCTENSNIYAHNYITKKDLKNWYVQTVD